ncbi:MAG: DUF6011 domain-containing protein, partial [Trebonia sp.]
CTKQVADSRGCKMGGTDSSTDTRNCLRCGRKLRSASALARGYGEGCWRKVRKAGRTADLSAWTSSQVEEAELAIEDGAVVPSTREDVFHVVSSDGSEVHRTAVHGCNCTNGLKTLPPRPCWHRCAVTIVAAASAPALRPDLASASVAAPAPEVSSDDIWAELDRMGATGVYAL